MNRLLIIDLESTCFEKGQEPPHFFSEIIEIGAVIFDSARGEIIDEFQCFVRPVLFPVLSDFCKKLTHITQVQVDSGWPLSRALSEIGRLQRRHEAVFASWGDYDRKQFERVCRRFGLPYPFSSGHI